MPRPNSLKPTKIDPRDSRFAFHKHFGSVSVFPDYFDTDAGHTNINQNVIGRPTACTALTITDIATDQDDVIYSHDYQLMKTFEIMNVPPDNEGADARAAFKVPVAFGLLPKELEPTEMAKNPQAWAADPSHWDLSLDKKTVKKPAYLPIQKVPGMDYFDSARSAMLLQYSLPSKERRPVGVASQWSPSFNKTIIDVIKSLFWGHMYKLRGWEPYYGDSILILKTWEGVTRKMTREVFNKLMSQWGTYMATLRDMPEDTIQELKDKRTTWLEVILALYQNLLRIKNG